MIVPASLGSRPAGDPADHGGDVGGVAPGRQWGRTIVPMEGRGSFKEWALNGWVRSAVTGVVPSYGAECLDREGMGTRSPGLLSRLPLRAVVRHWQSVVRPAPLRGSDCFVPHASSGASLFPVDQRSIYKSSMSHGDGRSDRWSHTINSYVCGRQMGHHCPFRPPHRMRSGTRGAASRPRRESDRRQLPQERRPERGRRIRGYRETTVLVEYRV
ncbi:hypothetical protein GCM10018780_76080 [Streptomyces lanatus]|nr:hypothetical protein GCM10018780_76080 [Streptomyces lanatus]